MRTRSTAGIALSAVALLGTALAVNVAGPAFATGSGRTSPHTAARALAEGAAGITFDEFDVGTAVTDQYLPQGVRFGGDTPFITTDDANPTSPVLAGTPRFQGVVRADFVTASGAPRTVGSFTVDVGYVDTPGAVTVTVLGPDGGTLDTVVIGETGVVPVPVARPGIAGFLIAAADDETAGFGIDNLVVDAPATDYVALGDSFSSGEGNPPFDAGTDTRSDSCHRSAVAWPRLLDQADPDLALSVSLACSGATVDAVVSKRFKTEPAQVKALAQRPGKPGLVTLTIGGNDVGFADILGTCYLLGDPACSKRLDQASAYIKKVLPGKLNTAYKAVRKAAGPGARIVVVGYPNLMNTRRANAIQHCLWVQPWSWSRFIAVGKQLDTAIAQAARKAGLGFVSVLDALAGHELCTATSWVRAIGPTGGQLRGHPIRAGQQAIADDVYSYLHKLA